MFCFSTPNLRLNKFNKSLIFRLIVYFIVVVKSGNGKIRWVHIDWSTPFSTHRRLWQQLNSVKRKTNRKRVKQTQFAIFAFDTFWFLWNKNKSQNWNFWIRNHIVDFETEPKNITCSSIARVDMELVLFRLSGKEYGKLKEGKIHS